MKKTSKRFKMMAVTVIMALIINLLPNIFAPVEAIAATGGNGSGVATFSGKVEMDNGEYGIANIPYMTELSETSNGYKLVLTIDPHTTYESANKNRTLGDNGYFTAEIGGEYLIEILGGKGGEGANKLLDGSGDAGEPGHVYGIVHLNVGDTLLYSIGGNGQEDDAKLGGGNNGGGHGDDGYVKVGTGGGYTAVYLFSNGDEALKNYIDSDGKLLKDTIDESDRINKVIMVAGGGGGGGADGADISISHKADGGAGGNVTGSKVVDTAGNVIFIGQDGSSSSGSSASDKKYVGIGGGLNPGSEVTSVSVPILGAASSNPGEDWGHGGNGGTGNLRGGGGGAGYTGGSGGVMKSILDSSSVGGGGGGSSFIKNGINYDDFDTNAEAALLKSEQITTIQNSGNNNGGIFHIVALNKKDDIDSNPGSLDFLKAVSLSYAASPYFDLSVTTNDTSVTANSTSVTGINFLDSTNNDGTLTVTYEFTRKDGFVGGNDVQLLYNDLITLSYSNGKTSTITMTGNCAYVNVPLKGFSASGKTVDYTVENGVGSPTEIKGTALYDDSFRSTEAGKIGNDDNYSFIDSITGYSVKDNSVNIDLGVNLVSNISTTKLYTVSYTVTPKTGSIAKIGAYQEPTTYSASAAIKYIAKTEHQINGDDVILDNKALKYNGDGTYTLTYESTIKYNQEPKTDIIQPDSVIELSSGATLMPGYYYVHVKGGDGGNGRDSDGASDSNGGRGGAGGTGASIEKIIHVKEYDLTVSLTNGSGGKYGVNDEFSVFGIGLAHWPCAGLGGKASSLSISSNKVIVAGGGAGGAPGKREWTGGLIGGHYVYTTGTGGSASTENSTSYNDGDATPDDVDDSHNFTSTTSVGTPGKSYIGSNTASYELIEVSTYKASASATIQNIISDAQKISRGKKSTYTEGGNDGYVVLVPLCYDVDYTYTPNTTYSFNTVISPYFDIKSVSLIQTGNTLANAGTTTTTDNVVNISDFILGYNSIPSPLTDGDYRIEPLSYTVEIKLTPKEGFLGGNDVPVIAKGTKMKISQGTDSYEVAVNDVTDYANVAMNVTEIENYLNSNFKVYDEMRSQSDPEKLAYYIGYKGVPFNKVCSGTTLASNYDADSILNDFVEIHDVTATGDADGEYSTRSINPFTFSVEPSETTNYSFRFSVTSDAPTKAVEGVVCEDYSLTKHQNVYRMSSIKFDLTNISVEGIASIKGSAVNEPDVAWDINNTYNYNCKLIPEKNYELPETVTITYKVTTGNGSDVTEDCSYDYTNGEVIVPNYLLKDNSISILAVAKTPDTTYIISYYYPTVNDDGTISDSDYACVEDKGPDGKGYKAGTTVYDLLSSDDNRHYPESATVTEPTIAPVQVEGYDFEWETSIDEILKDQEKVMPAQNIIIVGRYTPKQVALTINYLRFDDQTTQMTDPTSGTPISSYTSVSEPLGSGNGFVSSLRYGDNYSVDSPIISSYKACDSTGNTEILNVSGVINKDNSYLKKNGDKLFVDSNGMLVIEINVYYKETTTLDLIIKFVDETGTEVFDTVSVSLVKNDTYYVYLDNIGNNSTSGSSDIISPFSTAGYTKAGYVRSIYVGDTPQTAISGTITSSIVYTVKYVGEDVIISFASGRDGVGNPENVVAQYNKNYGYSYAVSDTTKTRSEKRLPELSCEGYSMVGWKIQGTDTMVTADTLIDSLDDISNGIKLIAVWEEANYTVTLNFYTITEKNGKPVTKLAGSKSIEGGYSHSEDVEMPKYTGYKLDDASADKCSENSGTYSYHVETKSNRTEMFYYVLATYTLTIHYIDDDNKTVWNDVEMKGMYYNDSYSVITPSITEANNKMSKTYDSVSNKTVSGLMPGQDLEVTVIYYKASGSLIISVTVTWDSLDFVYSEGVWNPETHAYDSGSFSPASVNGVTPGIPEITVTNSGESTGPIRAEISCKIINSFNEIVPVLIDKSTSEAGKSLSKNIAVDASNVWMFNLTGKIDTSDLSSTDKKLVGSVTVKISRGTTVTSN